MPDVPFTQELPNGVPLKQVNFDRDETIAAMAKAVIAKGYTFHTYLNENTVVLAVCIGGTKVVSQKCLNGPAVLEKVDYLVKYVFNGLSLKLP
jgi:hypothetical protein